MEEPHKKPREIPMQEHDHAMIHKPETETAHDEVAKNKPDESF
jgi:hypothetical protein